MIRSSQGSVFYWYSNKSLQLQSQFRERLSLSQAQSLSSTEHRPQKQNFTVLFPVLVCLDLHKFAWENTLSPLLCGARNIGPCSLWLYSLL